jgi:hypothetical protein
MPNAAASTYIATRGTRVIGSITGRAAIERVGNQNMTHSLTRIVEHCSVELLGTVFVWTCYRSLLNRLS